MSRGYYNQKASTLVNVAAGAATDATTYYYFDMREYSRSALQYVIAGAGTVTITAEATVQETSGNTESARNVNLALLNWTDISSTYLGAATKTASGMTTDSAGISGCCTFLRVKVVVDSSDATTAYSIRLNRTGS